nr:MAG TPA: hypothetical protein [Caudoviricetes sp.]
MRRLPYHFREVVFMQPDICIVKENNHRLFSINNVIVNLYSFCSLFTLFSPFYITP